MSIEGIDVSEHNGDINWTQAAKARIRFAVMKVNEGDYLDPRFNTGRVKAARKAGLTVGGYDFVHPRPGRTGAQEFDIHYSHARRAGLYVKGDLRPVIDFEASSYDVSSTSGRTHTFAYVRDWVSRCVSVTGHHPIMYTGFFWRDQLHDPNTQLGCQLWYPSYPTIHSVPHAWGPKGVTIHQYDEHGRVPGVGGNVDRNRYLLANDTLWGRHKMRNDLCLKR